MIYNITNKNRRTFLQFFADDAGAPASDPVPAGKAEGGEGAAAAQEKEDKGGKASDEKKYSDKDLDEILNKKFAKWQEKQQKAVDEAKKLGEMNAQEKAEYERDKLQKELDELKEKNALAEMSKVARKMLSDDGISVSDELLAMLVTTDATTTKAAVDGFSKAYKEAVENAVKDRLRGEIPKRGSGGEGSPVSEIQKRINKYS